MHSLYQHMAIAITLEAISYVPIALDGLGGWERYIILATRTNSRWGYHSRYLVEFQCTGITLVEYQIVQLEGV